MDLNQIEANWLTEALHRNGHLIQGCTVELKQDILRRAKYSDVVRLHLSYSADATDKHGAAPPPQLILKTNRQRSSAQRNPLFAVREFTFYSQIAPAMASRQFPRCYDAAFDAGAGSYHLLLEDLSGTHNHVSNPLPPPLSVCEQIVECLARFHAAWWNDPRMGTAFGKPYVEERWTQRGARIQRHVDKFLERLGDRLSASRRDILLEFSSVFSCLLKQQGAGPLTITHGDAHYQNFMLTPADADCRIIDWEDWELAPGTDDLAFLMAVLWFPERRGRLELDLLQRYHRTLLASGVAQYAWDDFWNDYRLSVVKHLSKPLYQWLNGIGASSWWNNLERVFNAYEDLGCAEVIAQLKANA